MGAGGVVGCVGHGVRLIGLSLLRGRKILKQVQHDNDRGVGFGEEGVVGLFVVGCWDPSTGLRMMVLGLS